MAHHAAEYDASGVDHLRRMVIADSTGVGSEMKQTQMH